MHGDRDGGRTKDIGARACRQVGLATAREIVVHDEPGWAPCAPGGLDVDDDRHRTIGSRAWRRADGAPPPTPNSVAELLATFETNVAEARAAIAGASDETLMQPWTLLHNGLTTLSLPRVAVLRTFVMNHVIHHRAQLGVYLRMSDVPVPSIYGPSADEDPFA